jgi:hypothetical protein
MRIRNLVFVGVGSFLVALALIGHIDSASAAYRRVHSSQCHYYYDNTGTGVYNGSRLTSYTTGRGIYCPAPSDSELPHSSTVHLNVHGYTPTPSSTYSRACAKAYNTSAYTCGALKYWGTGYTGVYGVSVSAWAANGAAFPVVYTFLPASASLYGFYMAT